MIFNGVSVGVEIVTGSYTGTGVKQKQSITLGFRPRAVLVADRATRGNYFNPQHVHLVVDGIDSLNVKITDTGFEVSSYSNCTENDETSANPYRYIAFK